MEINNYVLLFSGIGGFAISLILIIVSAKKIKDERKRRVAISGIIVGLLILGLIVLVINYYFLDNDVKSEDVVGREEVKDVEEEEKEEFESTGSLEQEEDVNEGKLGDQKTNNCDAYVDLGNEQDESNHNLYGWQGIFRNQPESPSGDKTFRYQSIRGWASLQLCVSQLGVDYLLVTEVQDYGCDDSFDIYINDKGPVYSYEGTQSNSIIVHNVLISSDYINSSIVKVSFKNNATDDCGAAGVYNIEFKSVED